MFAGILILLLVSPWAQSEDEIYRKDYAEVTEIQGLADPAQQADRLLAFVTNRPNSKLADTAAKYFSETLNKLTVAKNWDKILEASDKWLAARPNDKGPLLFGTNAARESRNWQKVADYGERAYAATPDQGIAFSLAEAYSQLKNPEKLKQYGEIAAKVFPIGQSWAIAYNLARQYAQEREFNKAAEYADLILRGFPGARPTEIQAGQWVFLMETTGRNAYERRQYGQAIELYSNVLRSSPRSDEAYYYIGQSYWKQNKLEEAMSNFAKAAVLNRGYSARAKQYLEEIYKSTHAGRLTGIEQYLDRARRELGPAP